MISRPTTFVIGAGGSCPYGLPTGAELLKQAKALKTETDVSQLILQSSIAPMELIEFISDIQDFPLSSTMRSLRLVSMTKT